MFQPYLLVSYVSSSNLPAIRKVLTFQVPKIILFLLARIFLLVTRAYFSPQSLCAAEDAVLVDPRDDRSGIAEKWLSFHVAYHGQIKPGGAHSSHRMVWV